jgi:hypothetical protein
VTEATWASEIGKEVERASWQEVLAELLRKGGQDIIYRGHRCYDWALACTLSRGLREQAKAGGEIPLELLESNVADDGVDAHIRSVEVRLLRYFMDKAEEFGIVGLPSPDDRVAWWELMQHHGVPTRLLDWTLSPFIALWFAVDHGSDAKENEKDGALWVFDSRHSWANHAQRLVELEAGGWADFLDDRTLQNRLAEQAIADQAMATLIVSPRRTLARVVAQQSVMTLIPDVRIPFGHAVFASLAT